MGRGRPVSFDREKTLETTLNVFWERGYLGTTYVELCAATGLNKPSLYSAFGSKEDTFLKALELYLERFIRPSFGLLDVNKQPIDAVTDLMRHIVEGLTDCATPMGCLIASNIYIRSYPDTPAAIRDALWLAVQETPQAIRGYLTTAKDNGHLEGYNIDVMVAFYEALIAGLAQMTRQNLSKDLLLDIVTKVRPF